MNLAYGEIVEILFVDEPQTAKVRVAGALKIISIGLLTDPRPGDKVLLCDGVAIGKVDQPTTKE